MKKLTFALAAAACAALGIAGRANAQSYYPPTSGVPTHVQRATGRYGTYGTYPASPEYPNYPGQYPQQYPTTSASREHHDWNRDRRDRDRRDDARNGDQSRYDSRYGAVNGVPTHVAQSSSRTYNRNDRDRWNDRDRR